MSRHEENIENLLLDNKNEPIHKSPPKKNRGKKLLLILVIAVMGMIILNFSLYRYVPQRKGKVDIQTLRDLSKLATVEFRLKKIVKFRDQSLFGGRRLLIEVPALIKGGIDLAKLNSEDIVQDGKKITLYLPEPEVLDLIIDMENVREVVNETGTLRSDFSPGERNEYLRQGEEQLRAYIKEGKIDVLKVSESNARLLLSAWLLRFGFEDIQIINRDRNGGRRTTTSGASGN